MRAYSVDLRTRALSALDSGKSLAEVAGLFQLSERTLQRWLTRRRDGLPLQGRTGPGRSQRISDDQLIALRTLVETAPDATLAQHLTAWNAHHDPVSLSTLARAIRRLGWTRKKDHSRQRARPARAPGLS